MFQFEDSKESKSSEALPHSIVLLPWSLILGKLMEMAVSKSKATGKKLHYGICGEHGGDPMSVEFCHKIGLDYVSCSPFRVPIARLAAAQAAINNG